MKQSTQFRSEVLSRVAANRLLSEDFLEGKKEPKSLAESDQARKEQITESFLRLSEMPTCPIARLSRYEYVLWRQARQIVITLRATSTQPRRERHKRHIHF